MEFTEAKDAWNREFLHSYIFEATAQCFCPENDIPFRITVRMGAIQSVVNLKTGEVLTDAPDPHGTINGLFLNINSALHRATPASHFRVEYHPHFNYPVSYGVDFAYMDGGGFVVDNGHSLEITSFTPIDPYQPTATPVP